MNDRSARRIAGACVLTTLSFAAFGSAAAADLPITPPPQAQVAPPPRYAPPPSYPNYYAAPPAAEAEVYPPPVAYEDYAPPAYYEYAPPPVVVVPRPSYWGRDYAWGPRLRGPFIARGYGHYERPFEHERFGEHGWGRRGW